MPDIPVSPQDPQKPLVAETVPSPVGGALSLFDAPERFDPPEAGRYVAHTFHMPGGMGRVWRATDSELGRDVALKEIRPKYANDEIARRRFEFEAEVTGRLEHPAIIPVYGYGWDAEGRPFYAMRFVDGQTLHDCLNAFHAREWPNPGARQLELRRLLNHFVTVCRAVAYAHSRGVIHRDLKPANVMLGAFGETFVLDWGIAKRLRTAPGEAAEAPLDGEDEVAPGKSRRAAGTNQIGTPEYWAPEQLAGAPELHDERTDVYGLGAVLYAVLTGSSPHPLGVHSPEPRSARAVRPWVDAGLDTVVTKALALEREARYQRADEVAGAVEEWLADQPLVAQRGLVTALAAEAATNPTDRALNEQLARQRMNLGLMLSGTGRDEPAATEFRACALALELLYTDVREPRLLADRAAALLAEAQSLSALERTDEAVKVKGDAELLYKELAESDPQQVRTIKVTLTHSQIDLDLPPTPASEPVLPAPSYRSAFDFSLPEVASFIDIEPPARSRPSDPEMGTASPLPPKPNAHHSSKSSFEFTLSDPNIELPPESGTKLTASPRALDDAPVPAPGSVPDIAFLFPPASKGDSVPDLTDLFNLNAPPPTPSREPPPPPAK